MKRRYPAPRTNTRARWWRFRCNWSARNPATARPDRTEYDAALVIATYRRNHYLRKTLTQLREEDTRHTVKIIVLNDGNPLQDIAPIMAENPDVVFLHNSKNNGKRRYWKTITTLLQAASGFRYHYLIQMDDDHAPVNNFFDTIVSHLHELDSSTILKYVTNENSAAWEFEHWVDGGAAYPRAFLDAISHKIDRVPRRRWLRNPRASSGVWLQVTKKLNAFGYQVRFLEFSMANHLGYEDSVMNTELRRKKPLKTLNFSRDWPGY